jgi:serine/threonine-protein kinase
MVKAEDAGLQKLLKDYWVQSQLGTGARSEVHQVQRRTDGKVFALKYIPVRSPEDLKIIGHLENEFSVLTALHGARGEGSKHIVRPVEFKKIRAFFKVKAAFLVMEKVPGQALFDHYDYRLHDILTIFRQTCLALEHIHNVGFVHADLKPQNILVDSELNVKLIDFGFAAPIGQSLNSFKGSFGYVAPEQAGGRLTEKTDVFNLGAALYWVLTGQNLPSIMPGEHEAGGFVPDGNVSIPLPSTVNPDVPKELAVEVVRCCRPNEHERPTVRQLKQYLHGLQLRLEFGTV